MSYVPTTTTRCALTHARRDDLTNRKCPGDVNMQVDSVGKAPQIEVGRV
jgi:hypothetical protein